MPKILFKIFYRGEWYDLSDYLTDFGLTEEAEDILPPDFWKNINKSERYS